MKILKSLMVTAAVAAALMANAAHAENKKIALVVKALGIGFFEAANKGAQEAAKKLGDVEIIYTGPTSTTAEGQIEVINSLIAQKVDAIAVSANDTDALVPALKKAMDRGIKVISWDSGVATVGLVGKVVAIDGRHDVDALVVQRETQGLIQSHPNLKAIIAPTSVGIVAAAQAVTDAGKIGQINVTGLGLPSEITGHVKSGASKSFAIWNPIDLGYSATMIAYDVINGAEAKPGAELKMGRMGTVKLDDNNEGAMADPFVYDASNVEEFAKIF